MFKLRDKKFVVFTLALFLSLGLFQITYAITKNIGESATITATCFDSDGNLSTCQVTSPCSKVCTVGGQSTCGYNVYRGGSLSCKNTCEVVYRESCLGGCYDGNCRDCPYSCSEAWPVYCKCGSGTSYSATCSCEFTCTTVGTYNAHGRAVDSSGQIGEKILTTALECREPNHPPTATNLYRDNPDWCVNAFQFTLNWTFSDPDGDTQYAKQIQVDDNSSFNSIDHDSGKIENNEIPAYTTFMSDGKGGVLQFNKTYYWRIKVWDSKGGESDWIESSQTLVTPLHAYPDPDFSFQPTKVREMETVQFIDESYSPVGIASWFWAFQDGNPPTSTEQNPTATFETPGSKTVALTVWDVDNYSCSGGDGTQVIPVSIFAPTWREIIPW